MTTNVDGTKSRNDGGSEAGPELEPELGLGLGPGPGRSHQPGKRQASWALDATDVDVHGLYESMAGHHRQFGFLDRATYGDFVRRVLLPNVKWQAPKGQRDASPRE